MILILPREGDEATGLLCRNKQEILDRGQEVFRSALLH